MKTPLIGGDAIIRAMLLEHWQLALTHIHFIPHGESAYSYRVETQQGSSYYLKVADQRTSAGRRIAAHMDFSLPLQRLVAKLRFAEVAAPMPQTTIQGALHAPHGSLLFVLYSFIHGDTLADAYPMPTILVQYISHTLATLHTVQIPAALQQRSPQDSLTAPFDAGLLADLASLEGISSESAPYLQRLREIVWPRQEQIRAFLAHSHDYARKVRQIALPSVVCHGDAWGGNIIQSPTGHITLLDWESAVMAPPERDAFIYMGFIGPDFAAFDAGYRKVHKEPIHWHADLLAYYGYRLQLRNLAHWLHNLLHEPFDEAQRENDVTMIEHHCLDRLESVERTAAELVTTLAM